MRFSFRDLFRGLGQRKSPNERPWLRLSVEELECRITPSSGPRLGPEFRVDSASVPSVLPATVVNAAGDSIVLWTNSDNNTSALMAQIYDAQHNAVGGDLAVTDGAPGFTGPNVHYYADVTADHAGNFDIVFGASHFAANSGGSSVLAYRSYGPQGAALTGVVILTAANIAPNSFVGRVVTDQAGYLVMAWQTHNNILSRVPDTGVYLMRLDTAGNPITIAEQLSGDSGNLSSVAASPDGHTLVVWQDNGLIMAQLFDESANPAGVPFVVSATATTQTGADVAADGLNHFNVVWQQARADGSGYDIVGRSFDSFGAPLGGAVQINAPAAESRDVVRLAAGAADSLTMAAQGTFTAVWQSHNQDGTVDVVGRQFDGQGNALNDEFQISTSPDVISNVAFPAFPQVALDRAGNFLTVWASAPDSQTNSGVFARWSVPPPMVSAPGPQSLLSNSTLTFSAAHGNPIAIADAGASTTDVETVYVQDFWGTLHIANTAGLGSISGNDTSLVTMTGTLSALNAALDGLRYTPAGFTYSYADTLSVLVVAGDGTSGSGAVAISVTHVNGPPTIFVTRGPVTVNDDRTYPFAFDFGDGLRVSDPDANGQNETVFVQVGAGTLSFKNGLGALSVTGNNTSLVGLTGTIDDLNVALFTFNYTPPPLFSGPIPFSALITDNGNTGLGGPLTASGSFTINVTPGNIPPVVDGPLAQPAGAGLLTFAAANGNAITVKDPDATGGNATVYVQTLAGSLSAVNTGGLVSANGNGTHLLTLTGSIAAFNTALDGLLYQAPSGISADYLNVLIVDDGDGSGVPKSGSLAMTLTVDNSTDLAPDVLLPGVQVPDDIPAQQATPTTGLTFASANGNAIHIFDGDATTSDGAIPFPGANESVILETSAGTLTLGSTTNVTVSGNGTSRVSVIGRLPDINAAIDSLHYAPPSQPTSSDLLNVEVLDGTRIGSRSLGIPLQGIPNRPIITIPRGQAGLAVATGGVLVLAQGNGNPIHLLDGDSNGVETMILQVGFDMSGQQPAGLAIEDGTGLTSLSGNGSGTIIMTGTIAALNAALDGLRYSPRQLANTTDVLSIFVTDDGHNVSGETARIFSTGFFINVTGS